MNYSEWLAAVCIWREARGQSIAAKTAIWWVIQNRANDKQRRWPRTVSGVIAQHLQFSSMTHAGDLNLTLWPVEPMSGQASVDWNAFLDCVNVVQAPMGGDPVGGANLYESEPPDSRPSWAKPEMMTAEIGPFRFYKS